MLSSPPGETGTRDSSWDSSSDRGLPVCCWGTVGWLCPCSTTGSFAVGPGTCSCGADGHKALGRNLEQECLTQALCLGMWSHQDGEACRSWVTLRWLGAGPNTSKGTRVPSPEAVKYIL